MRKWQFFRRLNQWLQVKWRLLWLLAVMLRLVVCSDRSRLATSSDAVCFELQNHTVFFRYYFGVIWAFKTAGWEVFLVIQPRFFARSRELHELLGALNSMGVRWRLRRPAVSTSARGRRILLHDSQELRARTIVWRQRVVLPTVTGPPDNKKTVVVPFWGSPLFLVRNTGVISRGQRNRDNSQYSHQRCYRVTFAGNCDPVMYRKSEGVCRPQAKLLLADVFRDNSVFIETWEQKVRLENAVPTFLLFVDSFKAGLNPDEYAQVLSQSDFFLVLPGIGSSLTHSLHECLTFGCVPIICESAELSAKWSDGLNCLKYHDEATLVACMEWASRMNVAAIEALRIGAEAVFAEAFSEQVFVERVASPLCEELVIRNV